MSIGWQYCQANSDQLLAAGLGCLRSQANTDHALVDCLAPGNYLVSLDEQVLYIGEAKCLTNRLRQQFNSQISTFYKSFVRGQLGQCPDIDNFRVRVMETRVGRKEIEEFGIVNVPCGLNKFQRGKRSTYAGACDIRDWKTVQAGAAGILEEGRTIFLSLPCVPWFDAVVPKCAGLYMVQMPQEDDILYVGESSIIRERYTTHSRHTYFSALRRHVGTEVLGFSLHSRNGRARYLTEKEDEAVTAYLARCRLTTMPVAFGRYELETSMIYARSPALNRKDNFEDRDAD